jgi:hypothetical protein
MTNDGRAIEYQPGAPAKVGFSAENATILPEGELSKE